MRLFLLTFAAALTCLASETASAQTAELEPGDAIYIPYFWWHHVRSLTGFNGVSCATCM